MVEPVLFLIEPKSSGVDVVSAAAGLGIGVHILDRLPAAGLPPDVRAQVAAGRVGFTLADTREPAAVVDAAKRVSAEREVVAAVPGFEYAVPAAAAVAAALGLRGPGPAAAEAMRDKAAMKRALDAAGVPVAPGVCLTAPEPDDPAGAVDERVAAVADVGYPAVVKPADGSGSQWVRRVDGAAELRAHLADVGANRYEDEGLRVGARLVVERYVAGREVSVEGYVAGGAVTPVAVTEKQLGAEPYFVEIGHVVEARLGAAERAALRRVAADAVRALGLTDGAFHLEARLGDAGPVVLEVGARLGGDRIRRLVRAVHGVDLPRALVCALAGRPVPVAENPAPAAGAAAARFFTVRHPGRLRDPAGLRALVAAVRGCVEVELYPPDPAGLVPARDFRHRFGHALLVAPDRTTLDARLAELDRIVAAAVDRAR